MFKLCVVFVSVCAAARDVAGHDIGKCGIRRYPHPKFCHKYLVCLRDSTAAFNCEAGDMFDAELQLCVPEQRANCGDRFQFKGENRIGSCRMVVCMYSYGGPLKISELDPKLCTHIHVQDVVHLTEGGAAFKDESRRQAAVDILSLKARNPNLKFILTIHDNGAFTFIQATKTEESRYVLTDSAIKLSRELNYDGLQYRWWLNLKLPDQYAALLQDTMINIIGEAKRSGKPLLLLSHLVSMKAYMIKELYYKVEDIHPHVDYTILHGMGLEGPWRHRTGHHSNPDEIAPEIDLWISKGHPADKIVLSLPLHGRCFPLADPSNTNIAAPSTGDPRRWSVVPDTRIQVEYGTLSYANTCRLIRDYNFTTVYKDAVGAPYMYKDRVWISYDDPYSLKYKVLLALARGLAGVSADKLNQDDYSGSHCGRLCYPLLNALVSACKSF